jgi:anionic cell wall polymer biosynthesis LytR-Cps2A-Psr (LCP) family protein
VGLGIHRLSHPSPKIIAAVVDERPSAILSENSSSDAKLSFKNPVTILLLGLDNRRGQKSSRCDAIHLLSYNIKDETLLITNIPRGTPYEVPGFDAQFSIISNACSTLGIDTVISGIEKMTNTPIDYVIKVGFSDVMGLVRNLNLPATETLMSLRSRAYGVGDNQRSYNQALFLKDALSSHLKDYSSFPKPFRQLMYRFTDSTLDFDSADALLIAMSKSKVATDSTRITIHTFSPYTIPVKDIHLFETLGTIKGEDPKDKEYVAYQQGTITYLQNLIKTSSRQVNDGRKDQVFKSIEQSFSQKIWQQIDDENTRDSLHFEMLSLYCQTVNDSSKNKELILEFINEMEVVGNKNLKEKGETLLMSY